MENTIKFRSKLLMVIMSIVLVFSVSNIVLTQEANAQELKTTSIVDTQAKKVKIKTVKKQDSTTDFDVLKKNSKTVKKGNNRLLFDSFGYLKFTPTKTKKYSLTFSNIYGKKDKIKPYAAYSQLDEIVYDQELDYNFVETVKLKTKGGKTSALWLKSKTAPSTKGGKTVNKLLSKRTGVTTKKLVKGKTYFIFFYGGVESGKYYVDLNIK